MEIVHADSSIQKSFDCMICQKSYPHEQALKDNTRSKHLKLKIHICELCAKTVGFLIKHQNTEAHKKIDPKKLIQGH
jgi:hypothetical protein